MLHSYQMIYPYIDFCLFCFEYIILKLPEIYLETQFCLHKKYRLCFKNISLIIDRGPKR